MLVEIRRADGRWRRARAADLKALAAKKLRGLAAIRRDNALRAWLRAEMRSDRAAALAVAREEAERERGIALWWRRMRVTARLVYEPKRKGAGPRPVPHDQGWLVDALSHPRYNRKIVDPNGRRGVFLRVRYYSKKTSKAGVGQRVVAYILDGAYLGEDGDLAFVSNMGETPCEVLAAADLLEQVNAQAQSNAKLLFHAIANVPYRLTMEAQLEIGRRFALEAFGCHDLPFVLALHPPSDEGDDRNWHLHILFSFRPMVRTGDHDWSVGEHLRTEFDNPQAFRRMREIFADVMTEVANDHGLNHSYSAARNVERGLPLPTQEHAGRAKTAILRRGEPVALVDRNTDRMVAGASALIDNEARHVAEEQTAEGRLAKAIGRRYLALRAALTVVYRVRPGVPVAGRYSAPPLTIRTGEPPSAMPISNLKSRVAAGPFGPRNPVATTLPPTRFALQLAPSVAVERQTAMASALPADLSRPVAPPTRAVWQAGAMPAVVTPLTAAVVDMVPTAEAPASSAFRIGKPPATVDPARPDPDSPAGAVPEPAPVRIGVAGDPPLSTLARSIAVLSAFVRDVPRRPIRFGLPHSVVAPAAMPPGATRTAATPPTTTERQIAGRIIPALWDRLRDLGDDLRAAAEATVHAPAAALPRSLGDIADQVAAADLQILASETTSSSAEEEQAERERKADEVARRLEEERRLTLTAAEAVLLAQIVREDLYVGDLGDGSFDISIENETRLGTAPGWRSSPAVQHRLAAIRREQQPLVATLAARAHRSPLEFAAVGERPWPRDLDLLTLGRLDAWSEDTAFQADLLPILAGLTEARRRDRQRDLAAPPAPALASTPSAGAPGAVTIRGTGRTPAPSKRRGAVGLPEQIDNSPSPER